MPTKVDFFEPETYAGINPEKLEREIADFEAEFPWTGRALHAQLEFTYMPWMARDYEAVLDRVVQLRDAYFSGISTAEHSEDEAYAKEIEFYFWLNPRAPRELSETQPVLFVPRGLDPAGPITCLSDIDNGFEAVLKQAETEARS